MKKLFCLLQALCLILALAACGRGTLDVESVNSLVSATAKNAPGDASGIGFITVSEGQEVEICADLKGDSVLRAELFPVDPEQIPVEVPDGAEPVSWSDFRLTDFCLFTLPAGDYLVRITARQGADGSLTARVVDAPVQTEDGQNPVMNFVGEYQCDRARALVECSGDRDARITVEWGGSAWELARWVIVGPLDPDTLTVRYADCVKSVVTYDDMGEIKSEELEYVDGTGTVVFHEDGTFTWHEDQSAYGEDMLFQWLPAAGE